MQVNLGILFICYMAISASRGWQAGYSSTYRQPNRNANGNIAQRRAYSGAKGKANGHIFSAKCALRMLLSAFRTAFACCALFLCSLARGLFSYWMLLN
jgi:hypothetical protein